MFQVEGKGLSWVLGNLRRQLVTAVSLSGAAVRRRVRQPLPSWASPLCLWWQSLGHWTTEAEEPRSLSPLVGPSGSRLVSRRKGKGPELGEAWQEGGNSVVRELLTQHSCALRAAIPRAAPQPWPTWSWQRSCSYSFWWNQQRPWESRSSATSWTPSCFSTASSSPCSTVDSRSRCERQLQPIRSQKAFTRA